MIVLTLEKVMRRTIKITIFMALFFIQSSYAAILNLDVCRFKADENSVYLELYIDLQRTAISHKADSDGWHGVVRLTVNIIEDETMLATDSWRIEDVVKDPADIDSLQKIVDIRTYKLLPGLYSLNVTAVDSLSQRSVSAAIPVEVKLTPSHKLTLSDIELSSHLLPSGVIPKYDRDEFALIPNVNCIFGKDRPYFYYYFEIYPPTGVVDSIKFIIRRHIITGSIDTLRVLNEKVYSRSPTPFGDVDSVSLEGLGTGSYSFNLEVVSSTGDTVRQSKRFYIYRPDIEIALLSRAEMLASTLDSATIEKELKDIEFLLTNDQMNIAKRMNITDKVGFINGFWRRYDDNPNTPEVPARLMFHERIKEADMLWTNYRRPGHKTDMGRVFVLCGKPDDREIYSLQLDTKPYEIWSYNRIEGGVIFVFVDRGGSGEYVMVHSTMRGEVSNLSWYDQYVKRSGMDSRR